MTEHEWRVEGRPGEKWYVAADAARWSDRTRRLYVAAFWTWLADRLAANQESHLARFLFQTHGPDLHARAAAYEEWAETGELPAPYSVSPSKWPIFFNASAREAVRHTVGLVTLSWAELFEPSAAVLCGLLNDILGDPFRPVALDPSWCTEAVVGLAAGIYADRAFDRLPVLADALDDAGCANADVLAHCRGPGPHARGCWVVDLVLGKA